LYQKWTLQTNYRKYTFPNFPSDNLTQETPEKYGPKTPRSLKAAEKKARNVQKRPETGACDL
jgi:hypothetical protein